MNAAVRTRSVMQLAWLSVFWFAWEVHWAALLGAALQGQIARFIAPGAIGTASALLGGAGAAFSILAQYAAGRVSDLRRRRMPFLIAGTLCDILALFGFALAPSFGLVLLAFVTVQISLNVACGPYQALMPDRVSLEQRGRASAAMGLFRLSGTAIGLLLAKAFVRQPGPEVSVAAFTSGLLHLAVAVSLIMLVALAVTVVGVGERPADFSTASSSEPVMRGWPQKKSFTWLIVSRALVNMGLYLILPFLAFYLRFSHHATAYLQQSLALLLIMTVCALAGTLPAGVAGDRMPKKTILFVALLLLAAGALSLAVVRGDRLLLVLAVVLGLGWGAYYSVDWALACMLLPPGRAGALMAIWNIGASAPQVAAPIIGGLSVDRIGIWSGDLGLAYRLLFVLVALFVVAGAAGLRFVIEPRAGLTAQAG